MLAVTGCVLPLFLRDCGEQEQQQKKRKKGHHLSRRKRANVPKIFEHEFAGFQGTRLKFGCSHRRTAKEAASIFEYLLSFLRDQNLYAKDLHTRYHHHHPFDFLLRRCSLVISLYLGHHRIHNIENKYRKLEFAISSSHDLFTYDTHLYHPIFLTRLPLITPLRWWGGGGGRKILTRNWKEFAMRTHRKTDGQRKHAEPPYGVHHAHISYTHLYTHVSA